MQAFTYAIQVDCHGHTTIRAHLFLEKNVNL